MAEAETPPTNIDHYEKIEIKPSIDLIPDEYQRRNNKNLLVEVIHPDGEFSTNSLIDNFTDLGYSVNRTSESMDNKWIDNLITGVHEKINKNSYDGLLMVFAKVEFNCKQLQDIWGKFTTATCPALKNKPKIFIFQVRSSSVVFDYLDTKVDLRAAYDTPSEADILIIYDIFALDSRQDFLNNFNELIKYYGHREDIISLASISIGSEYRPLVISTMTRKFFFTLNPHRGNHHNINQAHNETKKILLELKKNVKMPSDHKTKKKEKGFINAIKSLSFGHKHKNKKETKNEEDKEKEKHQVTSEVKEIKTSESTSNSKEVPTSSKVPTRKTSVSSNPSGRLSTRSRKPSTSTMNSKEDISKKPPWK